MRLALTGRHLDITPALRTLVDVKLAKLERLLNDSAVSVQAVLAIEKRRCRADVTLHARGENFLHGVGVAATWDMAIGQAVGKLAQQATTIKGKWQERKRRGRRPGQAAAPPEAAAGRRAAARRTIPTGPTGPTAARVRMPRILNASRQAIKPMTVADAAREVEAGGDGLIVFRDADTSMISVLFRRGNGELTLIETET
jgi:putative sigma-54 modulation protein